MVPRCVRAARPVVQPERQVRKGACIHRLPHAPQPGSDCDQRIRKQRIVVQMKAAKKRAAISDQRGGKKKEAPVQGPC